MTTIYNNCLRDRNVLATVLLVFILIILRTDATPALNIKEPSNITATENVTMSNTDKEQLSGDPYLDEAYKDCVTAKDTSACVKYKVLRYIHEISAPSEENGSVRNSEIPLRGPLKLVTLLHRDMTPTNDEQLFSESDPRSTDSEPIKLFRFILRELERFVKSYALAFNVPMALSSGRNAEDGVKPRLIYDFLSDSLQEGKNIQ
jgi:hypothetical protein